MAENDRKVYSHYVAIDFGTAGSTLAFATSTSDEIHPLADYSHREAGQEVKVATVLLLNPDKRFEEFGKMALKCYETKNVKEREKIDQYYLFNRFKMVLYSEAPEKVRST